MSSRGGGAAGVRFLPIVAVLDLLHDGDEGTFPAFGDREECRINVVGAAGMVYAQSDSEHANVVADKREGPGGVKRDATHGRDRSIVLTRLPVSYGISNQPYARKSFNAIISSSFPLSILPPPLTSYAFPLSLLKDELTFHIFPASNDICKSSMA